MKRQKMLSFYVEALLMILIFVTVILVLTGVFGAARSQSAEAKRLSQAVTLAANAAEAVSAVDSLEEAVVLLDEGGSARLADGLLEAFYGPDGSPCPEGSGVFRLTVTDEASGGGTALLLRSIAVYADGGETLVYTLETARSGKAVQP